MNCSRKFITRNSTRTRLPWSTHRATRRMSYREEPAMTRNAFSVAMLVFALVGCATTPTAPPKLDLPATVDNAPSLARWWTEFGDPTLDKLVDEALANNLDVAAAMARVESARAQIKLSQADLFPTADLAFD